MKKDKNVMTTWDENYKEKKYKNKRKRKDRPKNNKIDISLRKQDMTLLDFLDQRWQERFTSILMRRSKR